MATSDFKSFLAEARRRRVFRLVAFYAVGAWVFVQIALAVFPAFEIPEFAIRYVWIGTMLCLPVALVFAWYYDISGGRIVRTAASDADSSSPVRRGDVAVLGGLSIVVAIIAFGLLTRVLETRTIDIAPLISIDEQLNSIAVLPFVNMSDDPGNEYFSDGISEELLNLLSRIPDLRVISRSSSFSFKGKGIPVTEIGSQLGVAHILEGSVRKSGDQVRITAQLIDATTDTHLWSDTYDRELVDIFNIQDEISAAIVAALGEPLSLDLVSSETALAETNLEAHEAYLRARYLIAQRTESSVENAIAELEKAVQIDPDFALGHAELVNALLLGYIDITESATVPRAERHLEIALELDPGLAETQAAAGNLAWLSGDLQVALDHFSEAIRINPNYADVHVWMGLILEFDLGRYQESFEAREMAVLLDPLSIPALANHAYILMYQDRLAEADRQLQKLLSIAPNSSRHVHVFRSALRGNWANLVLGNLGELQLYPDDQGLRSSLAAGFAVVGLEKEALSIQLQPAAFVMTLLGRPLDALRIAEEQYVTDSDSFDSRLDYAMALAGAGDYSRARPMLDELWEESGQMVVTELGFDFLAAIIAVRHHAESIDGIADLIEPFREDVTRQHEAGMVMTTWTMSAEYEEGLVEFFSGQKTRGLALIARAVENGVFILPAEAYMEILYDEPAFAPIRVRQEQRQAEERHKVLAVVCNENPYSSVWQPADGTCSESSM